MYIEFHILIAAGSVLIRPGERSPVNYCMQITSAFSTILHHAFQKRGLLTAFTHATLPLPLTFILFHFSDIREV